jgi:hypothetical protein
MFTATRSLMSREVVKTSRVRRRAIIAVLGAAVAAAAVTGLASAAPGARIVIKTAGYPIWAIAGSNSIWVGAHHDTVLYRIDPRTNRISRTVSLGVHVACTQSSFGFGALFVADCLAEGGNTLEVSAGKGKVVRTLSGGFPVVGDGSVWTLDRTGRVVQRFDPQTGVKLATIPTGVSDGAGGGAEYLGTVAAGAVWLGDQTAKTVIRIDTATNKVVAVIPLPGAADQASPAQGNAAGGPMAYAGGKIWYGNPAGVYEIDPTSNGATLLNVKIGSLDAWGDISFATGAGSVWVRTSSSTVLRINPSTGNVVGTYRATGSGGGIAIAFGSLWVANAGSDTTWREPIR